MQFFKKLTALFIILKYSVSEETLLDGNFKYCQILQHIPLFNVGDGCQPISDIWRLSSVFARVFYKDKYHLEGYGYECIKRKHIHTYSTSFWMRHSHSSEIFYEELERSECEEMIRTQQCNNNSMTCVSDSCIFEYQPKDAEYSWLQTIVHMGVSCSFKRKAVQALRFNDTLFGNPRCTGNMLECKLPKSIVIWNETLRHNCPFRFLEKFRGHNYGDNVIVDINGSKVYQPIKKDEEFTNLCSDVFENHIWLTSEGFYIEWKFSSDYSEEWINNHYELESLNNIYNVSKTLKRAKRIFDYSYLSDADFQSFNKLKDDLKILYENCDNLQNVIRFCRTLDNEFCLFQSRMFDHVLYAKNNQLYIPACRNVYRIEIIDMSLNPNKTCYKHTPVRFVLKDSKSQIQTNKTGFLDNDLIIRDASWPVDCKEPSITMLNSSHVISRERESSFSEVLSVTIEHLTFETPSKTLSFDFRHGNLNFIELDAFLSDEKVATQEYITSSESSDLNNNTLPIYPKTILELLEGIGNGLRKYLEILFRVGWEMLKMVYYKLTDYLFILIIIILLFVIIIIFIKIYFHI